MMNALQTLREHLIAQAVPEEMVQTRIQEAETEISTMITEQTHLLTEQWENEHPGQSPTFVQLHELHNRARMMGEEMFLAQVIESIETCSPIELSAIGIRHDVSHYYRRALTIMNAEQLGSAMIGELGRVFDDPVRSRGSQRHMPG